MLKPITKSASNRLIDDLPEHQRRAFLAECSMVELNCGQSLGQAGDLISKVHFPLTAFASRVRAVDQHPPIAVGLVGNEGMLGETLWLGQHRLAIQVLVQGSGAALEMSAEQFLRQLKLIPELGSIVARYLFVLIEQLSQNTACNAFHEVRERLATWLLMTHDRAVGDHLELTHQLLSDMLGVRRSAVTIAARGLQSRGLIRYARGRIRIISRPGLEEIAGECYACSVQSYERQFSSERSVKTIVDFREGSRKAVV